MKMSGCWHWLVLPSVLFGLLLAIPWCWGIDYSLAHCSYAIFFGVLLLLLLPCKLHLRVF